MLSYEQLSTPTTEAEAEAAIIARLSELGLASTGWQSGSVQLTFVKLFAWLWAEITTFIAALVIGVFNDTATGEFLTRFSASHYDNTRSPAVAAQYSVRFTTAAGEGPHSVEIGEIVVSNGLYEYRNTEAGTLTSAAPVSLVCEAEIAGEDGGTAVNTITTMVTPIAGVTCTNPDLAPVRAGANEESDDELRERNVAGWSELAIDMPADGYKGVALRVESVARAAVDDTNPRGPGTVDVYVAGESTLVGAPVLANVQLALDARRSVVADVDALDPTPVTVTVAGIVYVRSSYASSALVAIRDAVETLINTAQIGGSTLGGSVRGIAEDEIIATIRAISGVVDVDLTDPTADIELDPFDLAVADVTGITVQAV